jgi:hypothetical protein
MAWLPLSKSRFRVRSEGLLEAGCAGDALFDGAGQRSYQKLRCLVNNNKFQQEWSFEDGFLQ